MSSETIERIRQQCAEHDRQFGSPEEHRQLREAAKERELKARAVRKAQEKQRAAAVNSYVPARSA